LVLALTVVSGCGSDEPSCLNGAVYIRCNGFGACVPATDECYCSNGYVACPPRQDLSVADDLALPVVDAGFDGATDS
jgi:hypothetical protein